MDNSMTSKRKRPEKSAASPLALRNDQGDSQKPLQFSDKPSPARKRSATPCNETGSPRMCHKCSGKARRLLLPFECLGGHRTKRRVEVAIHPDVLKDYIAQLYKGPVQSPQTQQIERSAVSRGVGFPPLKARIVFNTKQFGPLTGMASAKRRMLQRILAPESLGPEDLINSEAAAAEMASEKSRIKSI